MVYQFRQKFSYFLYIIYLCVEILKKICALYFAYKSNVKYLKRGLEPVLLLFVIRILCFFSVFAVCFCLFKVSSGSRNLSGGGARWLAKLAAHTAVILFLTSFNKGLHPPWIRSWKSKMFLVYWNFLSWDISQNLFLSSSCFSKLFTRYPNSNTLLQLLQTSLQK